MIDVGSPEHFAYNRCPLVCQPERRFSIAEEYPVCRHDNLYTLLGVRQGGEVRRRSA